VNDAASGSNRTLAKHIVVEEGAKDDIWWDGNRVMAPGYFETLKSDMLNHLKALDVEVQAHGSIVADRTACAMEIHTITGEMRIGTHGAFGLVGTTFVLKIEQELTFLVLGKGPEPSAFTVLTHSTRLETTLLSLDAPTLWQILFCRSWCDVRTTSPSLAVKACPFLGCWAFPR
jgi:hypothetical protein